MGEEEWEGKSVGCSREGDLAMGPWFFLGFLKAGSLGQVLGGNLNRIFISFMLMNKNESPLTSSVLGCGWQMALIELLLFISLNRTI